MLLLFLFLIIVNTDIKIIIIIKDFKVKESNNKLIYLLDILINKLNIEILLKTFYSIQSSYSMQYFLAASRFFVHLLIL